MEPSTGFTDLAGEDLLTSTDLTGASGAELTSTVFTFLVSVISLSSASLLSLLFGLLSLLFRSRTSGGMGLTAGEVGARGEGLTSVLGSFS